MINFDRNKSHFFEYGDRMLISVPQYLIPGRKVYSLLDEDFCAAFLVDRVCECTVTEVGSRGFWVSSFVPPQDDMGDFFAWDTVGKKDLNEIKNAEECKVTSSVTMGLSGASETSSGVLVMLPAGKLYPHPDNPRKNLGDLTELSESIKAKGVMQNLTVVPREADPGTYTIIIGHRRHAAAKKAKLKELPCVIVEMSQQEQVATMLLENIQRSDLTAYEQAKGFQMMMDLGDSVKGIVDKTGFSESTVRRRLKMAELDEEVLKKVSGRQISFGDIDKLQEIEDLKTRNKVLADIGTANFNNSLRSVIEKQKIDKELAEMRAIFNAKGLKEVTWNEYREKYNYEHAIDGKVDNLEERIDEAIGKGVTAYYFSYVTTFYLLTDKKAKVEKTPEQLAAEERERERKQRYSLLESTFAKLYQLRRDFINNYSLKQATINLDKIVSYMLVCGINGDLFDEIPKEEFEKLVFGKETVISSYEEMCAEIAPTAAAKALLVAVWLLSDDDSLNCHEWYCRYDSDARLEMVYEFLESLGYEMSDEERELITGESELYVKPEEVQ